MKQFIGLVCITYTHANAQYCAKEKSFGEKS